MGRRNTDCVSNGLALDLDCPRITAMFRARPRTATIAARAGGIEASGPWMLGNHDTQGASSFFFDFIDSLRRVFFCLADQHLDPRRINTTE